MSREENQVTQEVSVSRAMIDAGLEVLCDYEPDCGTSLSELAALTFKAMAAKLPLADGDEDHKRVLGQPLDV